MNQASIESSAAAERTQRLVLRNAFFLIAAQLLGTPLSILTNAVMARHLGAEEFGVLYLAWTYTTFAALGVEWGQGGALPAMVAKNHAAAGELLGTGLAWRASAWLVSYALLAAGCYLLGYHLDFQIALAFVVVNCAVGTLAGACQDVIRGFERTDVTAKANVGGQLLSVLLVIPTLLLGGRLHAVLVAQTIAATAVLLFVWRALRSAGVGRLAFSRDTLKKLLAAGAPFLFFGLAMALQPNVDAVFLSKLAPTEAVGWYAAARKLVGVLIFPATALITALYPTLCRLHTDDPEGFRRTARSALRLITVLVVPVATGCALYPDLGIRIFSRESFGPAIDDLRILSVFVLLVYFTMTLGICLLAAGRQRPWAAIQFLCVLVSVVLDPILVPWFQKRMGNGGLGVCVASVASEVLMLVAGIWLTPPGVFDRGLLRQLCLALLAGGAMAAAAQPLSGITPFVAAPLVVLVYVACLLVTGGIDKEQVQTIREIVGRKLRR